MFRLLLLAAFVGTASALTCYTCDSFVTCDAPRVEYCANAMQCYTVKSVRGEVKEKGCAAACASVPLSASSDMRCYSCSVNNCNDDSHSSNARQGIQAPSNYNFNNQNPFRPSKGRRSIGHGTGVQQPQIGHGASGQGSSYNAYGNNGGIGTGAGVGHHHADKHKHNIGHGAQAGHGIGVGAAPNKHHHRKRRSGTGVEIGGGVRPKASAVSLVFVPVTLAIAHLFK